MGCSRAGSNPADCEYILPFFRKHLLIIHDICTIDIYYTRFLLILLTCSHGRVVKGVWLEIRWDLPAQVRILLTARTFRHFSETSVDYSGYMHHWHILNKFFTHLLSCSHGRVVKASDSKIRWDLSAQVRILLTASTFCPFFGNIYWWFMIYARLTYITQDFYSYC